MQHVSVSRTGSADESLAAERRHLRYTIPVSVVLVPVWQGSRIGLLVIRRAIAPRIGRLALVGGFVEEQESWQATAARETREEAGVLLDPA